MKFLQGPSSYAAAVAAVGVATAVRWLLDPALGTHSVFVTYYPAVVVVAWLAAFGPAVVTLLLGAAAADYFFVGGRVIFAPHLASAEHLAALTLYAMTGTVTIFICGALRVAERRATRQRGELQVTLSSIGDGVITTDAKGRVTSLNPVAVALTGWSEAEAHGRALLEVFRIVNEDTRQPINDPVTRALAERSVVRLANHTILMAKDGTECPIEDSAAPILDREGKVLGGVLVFRDVTERRRASDRLRQTAAELSDANQRQREFLALLSHELRNPLAPIRNVLEILRNGGREGPTAKPALDVKQGLDIMARQFALLVRLVDDLLDVSRITRGGIVLRRERVELAAALQPALEAARHQCESRGLELTVAMPPAPLWLHADPARLAQIVGNLLHNAGKFTDQGGGIGLRVERQGSEAVIRVQDSGIGIAADQLGRIFDMFAQVDASIRRAQGGLGLGLTLAKSLVEAHRGSIEARSAGLGQGSEFVLRLPLLGAAAEVLEA
jgi:PAS domain S-box-containing protein